MSRCSRGKVLSRCTARRVSLSLYTSKYGSANVHVLRLILEGMRAPHSVISGTNQCAT